MITVKNLLGLWATVTRCFRLKVIAKVFQKILEKKKVRQYLFQRTGLILCAILISVSAQQTLAEGYSNFESDQVRPLALSPNGEWLFAVNTPAARLEVFSVVGKELVFHSSIPVGLEPVAIAAKSSTEVWVVNHLSDSVSIVHLNRYGRWGVTNTLLVGDEPRDIVFAGDHGVNKAYITAAHRGQNTAFNSQLIEPGIGRADVWVFDSDKAERSKALGGHPVKIINLFTDAPRALAVSNDGTKVYAAGFLTGNQTTVIPHEVVTKTLGLPGPLTNFEGIEQPRTSLIVKYNGSHWIDELGRQWDEQVKFSLPDRDVFVIDTKTDSLAALPFGSDYSGVGTVLFNMATNPITGKLFVSNINSLNEQRFEGPGNFAGHTVRGQFVENRISILDQNGSVVHRDLNKHINRSKCCEVIPNSTNEKSVAIPTGMVFSRDGSTLFVAALGSSKIAVYKTKTLENNTFTPDIKQQIKLSGGGPTGMVMDESGQRLYVMTRFNNSIAIVNPNSKIEIGSIPLYNPEPAHIVKGRPFLYDASHTSSFGDVACASCHIFAHNDALAWDLGNPDGSQISNPGPFKLTPEMLGLNTPIDFRPMKGPMTTQSLRGMSNHGPMHWRGDRTGGNNEFSAQPDQGTFNERAAFEKFNAAFVSLLGRDSALSAEEMDMFTDFALDVVYPPNPIRNLDNSLTAKQQAGQDLYFHRNLDRQFSCNGCHVLDPNGNAEYGVDHPGFFGTDGSYSFELEPQIMKIPQLRNLYQKVGMFGMTPVSRLLADNADGTNNYRGEQIRGFGFLNDGSIDTLERFMTTILFRFAPPIAGVSPGNPDGFSNIPDTGLRERREMESFLLVYPDHLAPIVGQQVTLTQYNMLASAARAGLIMSRADVGECDLQVSSTSMQPLKYLKKGIFSKGTDKKYAWFELLKWVYKGEGITFTCALPSKTS